MGCLISDLLRQLHQEVDQYFLLCRLHLKHFIFHRVVDVLEELKECLVELLVLEDARALHYLDDVHRELELQK